MHHGINVACTLYKCYSTELPRVLKVSSHIFCLTITSIEILDTVINGKDDMETESIVISWHDIQD